jgi:hypothetical protein
MVSLDYNKIAGKPPADPENVPYYSPHAGRELMKLEDFTLDEYTAAHPARGASTREKKRAMYGAVKVPVLLVNPEVDEVIYRPEIDLFWSSLTVPKQRFDLPGEVHTSPPKDVDDFYPGAQQPNKDFPAMVGRMDRFLESFVR